MRDIKYVENELERYTSNLKKINDLNLGFLLKGLYYMDKNIKDYVSNGIFKISFSCHDTGVSTQSYVIKPCGNLYQIASRTYWYNESVYGFNKKWYESGAWDEKYQEFIDKLREDLTTITESKIKHLENEILIIEGYKLKDKASVEAMFIPSTTLGSKVYEAN